MPLLSPSALLHAHLKQSPPLRPSNRDPSTPRPIQLNTGSLNHCNGSSLVKIGATTVVCGVRAEILPVSEIPSFRVSKASEREGGKARRQGVGGEEEDDATQEDEDGGGGYSPAQLYNLLVPNIELATGCSPSYPANTAPSVAAQSISQRLLSLLHTSHLVRTSDLEIIHIPLPETKDEELGINTDPQLKAYWTLYIDIMCISHGGSIFDAAWLALYAALRDTILPKAWWDIDAEEILCSPLAADSLKLNLKGMPVPSSFGVFVPEKKLLHMQNDEADKFWILMDMDGFEEGTCEESGCVTVDCSGGVDVILRIEKSGGSVVDVEKLEQIMGFAKRRWEHWREVLGTSPGP